MTNGKKLHEESDSRNYKTKKERMKVRVANNADFGNAKAWGLVEAPVAILASQEVVASAACSTCAPESAKDFKLQPSKIFFLKKCQF